MRTKRWMATCVVALLSVAAVLAKDIRVAGFKKFNYEAEFVKETKQDGKKDGKQESKKEDKKADKK